MEEKLHIQCLKDEVPEILTFAHVIILLNSNLTEKNTTNISMNVLIPPNSTYSGSSHSKELHVGVMMVMKKITRLLLQIPGVLGVRTNIMVIKRKWAG